MLGVLIVVGFVLLAIVAPVWLVTRASKGRSFTGPLPGEIDYEHVVAFGFGDVYSRPELAPRQRRLVTLGVLTALGGCEPQLDAHLNTALNVGLAPVEIVEALTHAAVYCGFPGALNAVFVAKRVSPSATCCR